MTRDSLIFFSCLRDKIFPRINGYIVKMTFAKDLFPWKVGSGCRKSPAISRTRSWSRYLSKRLPELKKKKKRGVIPIDCPSGGVSVTCWRPISLTNGRAFNAHPYFQRTWYPTTSHLLHALPLLDANSYPRLFVSYGDAHVPTGNIRLFDGGGRKHIGGNVPLYTCRELQIVGALDLTTCEAEFKLFLSHSRIIMSSLGRYT